MLTRLLLPAAACAALVVAPSAAQAGTPGSGGVVMEDSFVSAPGGAYAGKTTKLRGYSPLGGSVFVQVQQAGQWVSIGQVKVRPGGAFSLRWKPGRSGRYEMRVLPALAGGSDAFAQEAAAADLGKLTVYRLQRTTWYGPGNYSARTACGNRLTRRTLGVAHRTLPCGTLVEFYKNGRSVTVPVIDRGPFVRGVTWDLTLAAAKRVRMLGSERIGAFVVQ